MNNKEDEKHYVAASRVITIVLMLVSVVVTLFVNRISGAWEFILECGAGLGLVLILRWYWWRINAWSEISAMIAPFVLLPIVKFFGISFPYSLYYLVGITTVVWLIVTYSTKPTDEKRLVEFYRTVHPGGILWKKISATLPDVKSDTGFARMFLNWFLGVVLVYSSLFGIGSLILGNFLSALIYFVVGAVCMSIVLKNI